MAALLLLVAINKSFVATFERRMPSHKHLHFAELDKADACRNGCLL